MVRTKIGELELDMVYHKIPPRARVNLGVLGRCGGDIRQQKANRWVTKTMSVGGLGRDDFRERVRVVD